MCVRDAVLQVPLLQHCPHLRSVSLRGCKQVTDTAMVALANSCPHLLHLNVHGCVALSDDGIVAVAQCCHELAEVTCFDHLFHFCIRLTTCVYVRVRVCALF